jgi:nitrite reductase (NADH) large subunit
VQQKTMVVVGLGPVAHRFLEACVARGVSGTHRIVVFGDEPHPAYDRVALTSYLTGKTAQDLHLVADVELAAAGIELHLGDEIVAIDRAAGTVTSVQGVVAPFDELVLATGSYPFVPPVAGADAAGTFVYRTLDDLDRLRAYATDEATPRGTGLVVGGGLLGLEAAGALQALGLDTIVVEAAPRLLSLQVDAGGGEALRRQVVAKGIAVMTEAMTREVLTSDGHVRGVRLADGREVATDLVVFSAGVRPRDQLGRAAGLSIGERGGIVVDTTCTSPDDPRIHAIGEVACLDGRALALVGPGNAMAEVLADRLAGGRATMGEPDLSTVLKLLGVDVASFGDAFATSPGALELVYADPVGGVYKKLVVSDDGRRLLGGILVGDTTAYAVLRPLAAARGELPDRPELLVLPPGATDAAAALPGPGGLPAETVVCSCNNVTKGTLCAAVHDGAHTVPALKGCTRAGTSCGSCVALLGGILRHELAEVGVEVAKGLCEHFAYSRQELWQIVKVRGIGTFSELVAAYGTGRGCDSCKPAVASILATTRPGGHILDGEGAALQDTNDHFLANLQRNGTYSVVPRLPGGEVTPDKLIAIGEVARDFGLYMKITGGQRIDMFGARVEQLPAIWARLVAAGLESGHAYGKSLRTVKSCVGSTWCRYGVQDSVGLAVELELRYRGLRAPHKIKSGVSGCARECAEAQSKDFGVIATERGYNLYVGGNGGFRPKHAQLFASDVDKDTLVRYIDRFLMYYLRTADRLQRTAPWLEELEGGIEQLRRVIVDDALGICADLDADMAAHVAAYGDEWAAVLADPEKLARFTSFVNAPGVPDPNITFVPERDQIRPARDGERPDQEVLVPLSSLRVGPPVDAALPAAAR